MTDQRFDECMELICQGDKDALREIYEQYLSYIYSIVLSVVGNKDNAEDITSDFFIKLWTKSEKYVPGSGHKAYLATMARNMSIDYLRKYKREVLTENFEGDYDDDDRPKGETVLTDADSSASGVPSGSELAGGGSKVEDQVIGDISLKEALESLKPREREVINLKIMGDMTFKEIAAVLGAPMGTVTWLYRQAIEKLRRYGYE